MPGFTAGPLGVTTHGVSEVRPFQMTLPSSPGCAPTPPPVRVATGGAASAAVATGDGVGLAVLAADGVAAVGTAVGTCAVGNAAGVALGAAPGVQAAVSATSARRTIFVTRYLPLPSVMDGRTGVGPKGHTLVHVPPLVIVGETAVRRPSDAVAR